MAAPNPAVRQRHDQIKGLQGLARLGVAESALEDGGYLAAAIDVAESPVDGQAKILVAARQRQRIRLDRQIVFGQHQLVGRFAVLDQGNEDRPVAEIGRDLAVIQHCEALGMGLGGDDIGGDPGLASASSRNACSVVVPASTPIF